MYALGGDPTGQTKQTSHRTPSALLGMVQARLSEVLRSWYVGIVEFFRATQICQDIVLFCIVLRLSASYRSVAVRLSPEIH